MIVLNVSNISLVLISKSSLYKLHTIIYCISSDAFGDYWILIALNLKLTIIGYNN